MSHDEIVSKINSIDLESVAEKFLSRKSFWWRFWNFKKVILIEAEYKKFLYLIATHKGELIIPWTQDLDDFWHEHILDTRKYQEDCMKIFGEIVHHNPHVPKGTKTHKEASKTTASYYKSNFSNDTSAASCSAFCPNFMFIPSCGIGHCDSPASCSSHSHSDSGSSCSSGDSGGSSCSSGSSCGSSCGGGGGCGGGGD